MIDFLKKYSLPFGLKKSSKQNASRGPNLSYDESKRILIFFTSAGNQKIALIKNLKNRFVKEGKTVKCFYLLMNDEDKPDVGLDDRMVRLTKEDFTFFGKIESEEVKSLLSEEYDFMIHADIESNIYTDIVTSITKAKCRVGNYTEGRKNQYDMMVGIPAGKTTNFLLEQIYYYLKKL